VKIFVENSLESELLGLAVYEIPSNEALNASLVKEDESNAARPCYVFSKVNVKDVERINFLEKIGYQFVESQIKSRVQILAPEFNERFENNYSYTLLTNPSDVEVIKNFSVNTLMIDRFSIDPEIPRASAEFRLRSLIDRSFSLQDEEIWILRYSKTAEIIAFRSHKRTTLDGCRLLLGSIHPDFLNLGIGKASWYFANKQLYLDGIKFADTAISSSNTGVFNLEIGELNFRVREVNIVMKKILQ
jgi:hypothetical protein